MMRAILNPILRPILNPVLGEVSALSAPLPNGTSTVVARGSNYFNGTTDYYSVTDAANLDYPNGDWAVCALIKITRLAASLTQHIFNHGNTGGAQNARLYLANGVLTGIHRNATASITATGATLTANNTNGWFIVGMRRNGTNLEVFSAPVGGTVTVGTPVAINTPAAVTPSGNFFIGCRYDQAANNFLNNHLSYLFKLDGTLSNADINNLAAGQDIITNLAKSPSLYAKFDTSAATITDSGTGANVITRVGTPQARGCYPFTGVPVAIDTSTHGVDTVYAKVFQRAAGTTSKTLTFTGTYTGSPSGIEARVISSTGTQVVGWTRATTPTVGNWTVTLPNVPQGGQYALEVRHTDNVANMQRTQLPWGVGIIFVSAGESLEDQRSVGASGTAGTDFTANSEMISAWQQSSGTYKDLRAASPSSVVIHSLTRLSIALGIPVAHYNGATSGTTLLPNSGNTWSVSGSTVHTTFATALTNAGGDAEVISIRLGTNDGNNATQRTQAEWAAQFPTMVSLLRANFSRTAAQLPVFASETARNDATSSANDNNFRAVRNAQQATIPTIANCFTQGASHSLTHDDDLHPSGSVSGHWRFEKMFAQAVLNYLDSATYTTGLKGAEPTGAVINGNDIDISYTLNNGTTLQGLTGATGLTGFVVYGAATSISGITETVLTVSTLTRSGSVATATTSAAHGLSVGQPVFISGASGSFYNGQKIVASTPTSTTFTYTISITAAASATGTMRAAFATATSTAHGLATNDKIGVFGATTNEYNMADATVFVVDANTFRYGVHQQAATPATGTITFRKQISITTTAIPTATMVRLTPASTPQSGIMVDYVGGQNPVITNMLYTDASVIGDTAGVPARAWTAGIPIITPPLLDSIGTASSAAYSLRKLRAAYSGSAIRVRRSQDNVEANIAFTADGDLDQVALLNHVGYENVFVRSEEFDNAVWLKGPGATITANSTTDPLGGSTADRYNTINASANYMYQTIGTSGIKTQSIYAKQGSNRYLWIYGGAPSDNYGVLFDLQNGVVVTTNTNGTPTSLSNSITSVGNGWYRCSITYLPTSSAYQAFSSTNNASPTYSINNDITNGTVGNIFIWGGQLQNSGILRPYQQTIGTTNTANGFVTTWYDQSTNGYNATQTSAANQPQIVTSGVVNLENGKPDIDFASTKWLSNTAVSANASLWGGNPQTMNVVARTPNTADGDCFSLLGGAAAGGNLRALGGVESFPWRYTTGTDLSSGVIGRNTFSIATGRYEAGNNNFRTNGVSRASSAGVENSTAGNLTIGARISTGGTPWLGVVSEAILFNTSLSDTDALVIERNQGQYYAITVA